MDDCLVAEMLWEHPIDTVHDITYWFGKRFRGECRSPAVWKILIVVFLKEPEAKLEQGIRRGTIGRTIALMSVVAKWYAAVVVGCGVVAGGTGTG